MMVSILFFLCIGFCFDFQRILTDHPCLCFPGTGVTHKDQDAHHSDSDHAPKSKDESCFEILDKDKEDTLAKRKHKHKAGKSRLFSLFSC
jgi:hypothetical protein